jgi:endonuclease G
VRGRDVWLAKNGKPWTSDMGDDQVDWMANEGVRVSRIVQFLQSQYPNDPLAQAVVTAEEPRSRELLAGPLDGMNGYRVRSDGNGHTRILVPVEIGIKVGVTESSPIPAAEPAPDSAPPSRFQPRVVESVIIDQGNYNQRNGFNPKFLGAGLTVGLPAVPAAAAQKYGKALVVGGSTQIKYWNYSVVMNASRKQAYFSAANIDSNKFRGTRDADGDKWYRDTRVDKVDPASQLGQEFYKKQSTFEADRSMNPFDQGHLTRRSDLQWGADDDEAKRNGDDSYHYTNCSPQHWQFNQNNKASGLWFRLEESAIKTLSRGARLCVINGPIFDSPLCLAGSDGLLRLNLNGKRVKDGTFGDVRIPKMFFKVIAYAKDNKLRAKAFVVTQEDLLATIDRYYPAERASVLSDQEVRLYQVKIADLEKVTGLKFGSMTQHDVPTGEESASVAQGTPIDDEGDLEF